MTLSLTAPRDQRRGKPEGRPIRTESIREENMKVLLIQPDVHDHFWTAPEGRRLTGKKSYAPPLGLITLAALLPQEWEFTVVDLAARPVGEDDWNWADLVMISGMIVHRLSMIGLVHEAKRRGKKVVVGGPYATSAPDEIVEAGADCIVRGEAENAIPLLLEALANDGGSSTVLGPAEKPDIASTPIPRFDLLDFNDYIYMTIQCSRGCPFDCEFCDVVNLLGRKVRFKSDDQVISELDALYDLGWRSQVFVCDDNFVGSRKQTIPLLHRIIEWQEQKGRPFSFTTQASINLGRDDELIDLMTAARFGDVLIGIESADTGALEKAGKQQNLRGSVEESINHLKKNGLRITGSFILGADGEKEGAGARICELVERTDMPIAQICTMWALPNTRLWHRLKKEGRLLEDVFTEDADIAAPIFNFVPSRPADEILTEYKECWDRLYDRSNYIARAYRYFRAMRPTRKALGIDTCPPAPAETLVRRTPRELYIFLLAAIRVIWRQGIASRARIQFWRQAVRLRKENPSRWKWYMLLCAAGEDLFRIRRAMLQRHRSAGS